jgi:hypothetical protein
MSQDELLDARIVKTTFVAPLQGTEEGFKNCLLNRQLHQE